MRHRFLSLANKIMTEQKTKPTSITTRYWQRAPLLLLAAVAMLAGLWGGVIRIGWQLPPISWTLPAQHGPLMISGFLGTLISLERAAALSIRENGRRRYYLVPLLAGLGGIAMLTTLPPVAPRLLSAAAALGLVLIFVVIIRLQPTADHLVMGLGAALWLIGGGLWLAGQPIFKVVPWWAGFLILTIAGERLELGRVLLHKQNVRRLFLAIIALFLVALALSLIAFDAGLRLAGFSLIALALWLLQYDIARRTIRQKGLTRYMAVCLLLGYVWLLVGGGLWLIYGGSYVAGPIYDALLHTIFIGFVFSMIFGHAPIILPALLEVQMPYTPLFYLHLTLLHLTLVLRTGGDLFWQMSVRRWGGMLNGAVILLFLLVTVGAVLHGRWAARKRQEIDRIK
jgi:hypothetical protein